MAKFKNIIMLTLMLCFTTGCMMDDEKDIISFSDDFKLEGEYEYIKETKNYYLHVDDIEYLGSNNVMADSIIVSLNDLKTDKVIDSINSYDYEINDKKYNLNEFLDDKELRGTFSKDDFDLKNIYVDIIIQTSDGDTIEEKCEFSIDR